MVARAPCGSLSRIGLVLDDRLPYAKWQAIGERLTAQAKATSWWLGDWLAFGEDHYGARYADAIERTGLEYKTLRNYAVVARRFGVSRRRDTLSFQHHAELCAMVDSDQDRWLDVAERYRWSRSSFAAGYAGQTADPRPSRSSCAYPLTGTGGSVG
jgi:hypothetical protein